MSNILLAKNYRATAAVGACLIAKLGANDGEALGAAASTDLLIGITTDIAAASGERFDVIRGGLADVVYGGTVTRGQKLTSDASSRAIAAAPGAGVNAQIIGIAEVSGVVGDLGQCLIAPSVMQG